MEEVNAISDSSNDHTDTDENVENDTSKKFITTYTTALTISDQQIEGTQVSTSGATTNLSNSTSTEDEIVDELSKTCLLDPGDNQNVNSSKDQKAICDSQEIIDTKKTSTSKMLNMKVILQYSREFLCFFALLLTTYASLQNSQQPKIYGAPTPKPIFGKGSLVQEWHEGQLNEVHTKVAASELSLIFFYAPWCAESLFAKSSYNAVANIYYKEVFFAAVNCWQPGGGCRNHYSKVYKWPVLMAYLPKGFAIQYNGEWDFNSISQFIEGLLTPFTRIHSNEELLNLRIANDAVVLGVFNNVNCIEYKLFVRIAIKWLETDPLQNVRFAVYTGAKFDMFTEPEEGTLPIVKLYNFNETIVLGGKYKWNIESAVNWIKKHSAKSIFWLDLPTVKNAILGPYFERGPVMFMFSPRTMFNDDYIMLKQLMLVYKNCNNYTHVNILNKYIPHLRTEKQKELTKLKKYCKEKEAIGNIESVSCSSMPSFNWKTNYPINASTGYNSRLKNQNLKAESVCKITTPILSTIKKDYCRSPYESSADKCGGEEIITKCIQSKKETAIDYRSPLEIMNTRLEKQCAKLSKQSWQMQEKMFRIENGSVIPEEFNGFECKYNRSLSFLMFDNLLYSDFVQKFTGKRQSPMTSLFIVDSQEESVFSLQPPYSVLNVLQFIKQFFERTLKRYQRSSTLTKSLLQTEIRLNPRISDINSRKFRNVMRWTNATLVMMIYSPHCALCSVMSQVLLQVSTMTTLNKIHYFRIDANSNDLPWEYTTETYPTLLVFPKNRTTETRVFPATMKVNVKNVFGFIVANLERTEQLIAIVNACTKNNLEVQFSNCMKYARNHINDEILHALRYWEHHPKFRIRTLERLKVLRSIYFDLLRAKRTCDVKLLMQSKDFYSLSYNHSLDNMN